MTDPTSLPRFDTPAGNGGADQAPPPDGSDHVDSALRDRILQVLADQGFRPEVDGDGDVVVRVEGQSLFVRCFTTSPPMVRVFGQWSMGEDAPGDAYTRLRAANAMTGALNLVKVTALDDWLVVAVDLVVTDTLELDGLLPATLDAVRSSVQTWVTTVVQLMEEGS